MPDWIIYLIAALGLVAVLALWTIAPNLNLYVQAKLSGAHVSMLELIGMRLRKVDSKTIVFNRIRAVKAGLNVPTEAMEAHALAGGRVGRVIGAMLAARKAKIELSWDQAAAWDLAGEDVMAYIDEVVKSDAEAHTRAKWSERIVVDSVSGCPRFRRSGALVADVLDALAIGRSKEAVMLSHGVEAEDISAALAYAAATMREAGAATGS